MVPTPRPPPRRRARRPRAPAAADAAPAADATQPRTWLANAPRGRDGRGAAAARLARVRAAWGAHATRLCAVSGDVHYAASTSCPRTPASRRARGARWRRRRPVRAPSRALADGVLVTDPTSPRPAALIVAHARRDPTALVG